MRSQNPAISFVAAITFIAFNLIVAQAKAQTIQVEDNLSNESGLRLKLSAGWQSESDAEVDAEIYGERMLSDKEEFESGYSLAAELEIPIANGFRVGPRVVVEQWNSTELDRGGVDPSTMVLLQVVPKFNFSIRPTVDLYLSVPVGLSVFLPTDELEDFGIESGGGFNGAVLGGVEQYWDSFGLFVEAGIQYNAYKVDWEGPATDFVPVELYYARSAVVAKIGGAYRF